MPWLRSLGFEGLGSRGLGPGGVGVAQPRADGAAEHVVDVGRAGEGPDAHGDCAEDHVPRNGADSWVVRKGPEDAAQGDAETLGKGLFGI